MFPLYTVAIECKITDKCSSNKDVRKVFKENEADPSDDNYGYVLSELTRKYNGTTDEPIAYVYAEIPCSEIDDSVTEKTDDGYDIWNIEYLLTCKIGDKEFQHLIKQKFIRDGYGGIV